MIKLVIGGQYGSEGKGSVVSWLAQREKFDLVIRTGAPNAGHTFKKDNELFKMRQLPCSWGFQDAPIYIPAGAVIDFEVLSGEMVLARQNGYKGRFYLSPSAAVINPDTVKDEESIITGTTGKGVGITRASKCLRKAVLLGECVPRSVSEENREVAHILDNNTKSILVEATQGFGLSLSYKEYPYCTSADITVHQVLNDAEIPFGRHDIEIWMVLRTFPIRIAGNSGPLFNETSWEALRQKYGNHIPDEQTTVTKKTRRVGEFDFELARDAIRMNSPTFIVLTFVDYIFPNISETGVTQEVDHWINHLEGQLSREVDYLGIGIGKLIERQFQNVY